MLYRTKYNYKICINSLSKSLFVHPLLHTRIKKLVKNIDFHIHFLFLSSFHFLPFFSTTTTRNKCKMTFTPKKSEVKFPRV